jgi:hypothetical protein
MLYIFGWLMSIIVRAILRVAVSVIMGVIV